MLTQSSLLLCKLDREWHNFAHIIVVYLGNIPPPSPPCGLSCRSGVSGSEFVPLPPPDGKWDWNYTHHRVTPPRSTDHKATPQTADDCSEFVAREGPAAAVVWKDPGSNTTFGI